MLTKDNIKNVADEIKYAAIREEINNKIADSLDAFLEKFNKNFNKELLELQEEYKHCMKIDDMMRNAKVPKKGSLMDGFFSFMFTGEFPECPQKKFYREQALAQYERGKALRNFVNKAEGKEKETKIAVKEALHTIRLEYDYEYKALNNKKNKVSNANKNKNKVKKEKKVVYKRPEAEQVLGKSFKTSKLKKTTPETRLANRLKLKLKPKNSRPY